MDRAAGDEHPEHRGLHCEGRLSDEQHPAFVEAVGHQAANGAKEEHRSELQGRCDAQIEGAVGELQHQPVLGHRLHPGTTLGDGLAEKPEAVVARPQGAKHAPQEGGDRASRLSPGRRSTIVLEQPLEDRQCLAQDGKL